MDQDAKKTALRMIPYGIYVLTTDDGKPITGRPDAAILEMKELGDNVFYGG